MSFKQTLFPCYEVPLAQNSLSGSENKMLVFVCHFYLLNSSQCLSNLLGFCCGVHKQQEVTFHILRLVKQLPVPGDVMNHQNFMIDIMTL